jgi:hypothetical protein
MVVCAFVNHLVLTFEEKNTPGILEIFCHPSELRLWSNQLGTKNHEIY